jgi:hypothetical protein
MEMFKKRLRAVDMTARLKPRDYEIMTSEAKVSDIASEKQFLRRYINRKLKELGARLPAGIPITIRLAPLTHPLSPLMWKVDMPICPGFFSDTAESLFLDLGREFDAVPCTTPYKSSFYIFIDRKKVQEKMAVGY